MKLWSSGTNLTQAAKDCPMLNPNRRAMSMHACDMSWSLNIVQGGSADSGLLISMPS